MLSLQTLAMKLGATTACTLLLITTAFARADERTPRTFDIGPQSLATALSEYARQSQQEILFAPAIVADKITDGLRGTYPPLDALKQILGDTGLTFSTTPSGAILVQPTAAGSDSSGTPSASQALNNLEATDIGTAKKAGFWDRFRLAQNDQSSRASDAEEAKESPRQDLPSPQETSKDLPEIVVTGSRFKERTALTSPVPVDMVSARELRGGGYTELTQSLEAEVAALSFPPVLAANGYSALRTFTYRGLPSSEVLVLVNGKRWHPATFLGPVTPLLGNVTFDLNSIPPTAIGSVQILRDGASAQYGSDAIAGVMNLMLRNDSQTELVATGGQYYQSDGETVEFALDTGWDLFDNGFVHVSTYYRDSKTTNRQGTDITQQYFASDSSGTPVSAAVGNVFTQTLPAGIVFDPREFTGVDRNNNFIVGNSLRREAGLSFNMEIPLSGAVSTYAFGGYTHREVETPGVWRAPRSNNTVRAIFPDGYEPIFDPRISDVNAAVGVKGLAGEWEWDLSESWGFSKVAHYTINTLNASLGTASPTEFYRGFQRVEQATTNLDLRRSFDVGLAAPLRLATGSEFRYEAFEVGPGEPASYVNGGVPVLDGPFAGAAAPIGSQGAAGFTPTDAVNSSRHSIAAYADVENQLTKKLLLTAAARYEDYSDFGSTFNGKVSFFDQITDMFALRGSASTGFRAPSLLESNYSATTSLVLGGQFLVNRTFPVDDPVALLLGAKPLEPETSRSFSLGTTLAVNEALNFTLDAYRVYVDDSIIPSSFFSGAAVSNFLTANGYPGINAAQFFINAVDKRVDGIDLEANYTKQFDSGSRLALSMAVNVNEPKVLRVAPTPPQLAAITPTPLFDPRSIVIVERGTPRTRIILSATYDFHGIQFFLRETRYGSVKDIGPAPPLTSQEYSGRWITDLDIGYDLTKSLRLTAGGHNLFDEYPDKSNQFNNPSGVLQYQSSFAHAPFGLNGGYYYARAVYRF